MTETGKEYAQDTVAGATVCAAGRVGTYLTALGAAQAAGGNIGKSVATQVSDCVMGAIAPVPPCTCGLGRKRSFAEGTEVLTPEGKVAIETLREGDMVVARNEETGVSGIFPVSAVMKGETTALRWLTLADANGETSRLGLTGGHPMFVVGAGWVHANEVVEGDRIRDSKLRELTVLSIERDTRPQIVHNLEVADAHTYFAGELEAWGHNGRKDKYGDTGQSILSPDALKYLEYWIEGGICPCGCGEVIPFKGGRQGDRSSIEHVVARNPTTGPSGSNDHANRRATRGRCNSGMGNRPKKLLPPRER